MTIYLRQWPGPGLVLLAQVLVVIDGSIVTLALSAIQRGLGFSPVGLQWVLSGYARHRRAWLGCRPSPPRSSLPPRTLYSTVSATASLVPVGRPGYPKEDLYR